MALCGPVGWGVARAAYPVVVLGSVLGAHVALGAAVPAVAVVVGAFLAALVAASGLERALPFAPRERPARGEVVGDLAYLGLAAALQPVGKAAGALAGGVLAVALSRAALDAGALPTWVKVTLALLSADLAKYMIHRASHESAWLFRFHAEHHAPDRLYALNGVRLHPVNLLWNLAFDAAPVALFGLDAHAATLLAVTRGAVAVLQHTDADLRLGPLDWIFSTPTLHRFHHSAYLREANANYGSTLIVWDVLFGTRRLPRGQRAPATLGLTEGEPHPVGLRAELLWPFCAHRAARCTLLGGTTLRPSSRG